MNTQSNQTTMKTWFCLTTILALFLFVGCFQNAAAQNTFPASGNAGVGTTTPAQVLTVKGTTAYGQVEIQASGTNAESSMGFRPSNIGYGGTGHWLIGTNIAATNMFTIWGGGSSRFNIDSSGNVGIGTSTPGFLLDLEAGDNNYASPRVRIANKATGAIGNFPTFEAVGARIDANTTFYGRVALGHRRSDGTAITSGIAIGGMLFGGQWGTDISFQPSKILYAASIKGIAEGSFTAANAMSTGIAFYSGSIGEDAGAPNTGYGTERMRISNTGNVGIGTTAPAYNLDVQGGFFHAAYNNQSYPASTGYGGLAIGWNRSGGSAEVNFYNVYNNASAAFQFSQKTGAATADHLLTILGNGNVGIGNTNPSAKLAVAGNVQVGDTPTTGNLTVGGTITGGNIIAKYQDVAEWVQSSQTLSAGTVVVLDQSKSNQVVASSESYDTRVAGVISAKPGITLGESGSSKVLVATTGRVRVKVDASLGAIHIGDLLVTSDKAGFAMKSEPVLIGKRQMHAPGTLIGKALEPLANGQGEILVLLSLQ